uniref:Putative secreted peptide n=1 Tax=Anopheles braziliensis TaxID=58242 RepID=A0A2M3ZSF1_9DIPT
MNIACMLNCLGCTTGVIWGLTLGLEILPPVLKPPGRCDAWYRCSYLVPLVSLSLLRHCSGGFGRLASGGCTSGGSSPVCWLCPSSCASLMRSIFFNIPVI